MHILSRTALHGNAVLLVISKLVPRDTMQTIQQTRKIEDDSRKEAILDIMSDKYCRGILLTIMDKPMSAMEIAMESKFPISTIYRRLQTLHDSKLVRITGSISEDGKKYFMYKSKIKRISATCNGNDIEVSIVPTLTVSNNLEENYVSPNAW